MNSPLIIGGSAGSFAIIFKILPVLKYGFQFPVIICVHRLRTTPRGYLPLLIKNPDIPIIEPENEDPVLPGNVYISPADNHLRIDENNCFQLGDDAPVNYSRPSIDVTMKSAAEQYGKHLIGVLLSGANADGAEGMKAINDTGGITIVQAPEDADISVMPQSAIDLFTPGYVLSADKIINFIEKLTGYK